MTAVQGAHLFCCLFYSGHLHNWRPYTHNGYRSCYLLDVLLFTSQCNNLQHHQRKNNWFLFS